MNKQRILVTGANGFIGKNLLIRLGEQPDIETLAFVRGDSIETLTMLVARVDAVIHLAAIVGDPACKLHSDLQLDVA